MLYDPCGEIKLNEAMKRHLNKKVWTDSLSNAHNLLITRTLLVLNPLNFFTVETNLINFRNIVSTVFDIIKLRLKTAQIFALLLP